MLSYKCMVFPACIFPQCVAGQDLRTGNTKLGSHIASYASRCLQEIIQKRAQNTGGGELKGNAKLFRA